jgi:multiple sugar transport system permease protein
MRRGDGLALTFLPAALLLGAAVAYPIARVLVLSMADHGLATDFGSRWRGLEPYARLALDGRYRLALANTAVFTAASTGLEGALGLGAALLLRRAFAGRRVVRTLVLLPWAMPTAVMALAWSWIFNDAFGVANDLLLRLGLVERPVAWLAEPGLAMAALVIADVWKTTPFVALILLAGLAGIPDSIEEAATVDGIGRWRRLTTLTLPLLAPFIGVALVFRAVQAWAAFDLVYVMTGGGPGGATETVSLHAQQTYFRYLDFGYGSTIAVGSIAVLLAALGTARALAGRRWRR